VAGPPAASIPTPSAPPPARRLRPIKTAATPLDIGLFETRPPEAPHIVMPDE
jgi:hypothetical protein